MEFEMHYGPVYGKHRNTFAACGAEGPNMMTTEKPSVTCEDCKETQDFDPNYDGAPYCPYGHPSRAQCDCGPIASSE